MERIADPGRPGGLADRPGKGNGRPDPMLPRARRLLRVRRETHDTFTFDVETPGEEAAFEPGQFNMLYVFGVGEVPVSIAGGSRDKGLAGLTTHTVRRVGTVTTAMAKMRKGDTIGIRGPFGAAWPMQAARGKDVVIVAGGIGLAPLREAILRVLRDRPEYGRLILLYGARTPEDLLYPRELREWGGRFDVTVTVTVDRATEEWNGRVGVVPDLVQSAEFDPSNAVALTCGPEIMMRYTAAALRDRGVAESDVYLSMERNMKCAVGFCGHCQFGPEFVCKDGPVFRHDRIGRILSLKEI